MITQKLLNLIFNCNLIRLRITLTIILILFLNYLLFVLFHKVDDVETLVLDIHLFLIDKRKLAIINY